MKLNLFTLFSLLSSLSNRPQTTSKWAWEGFWNDSPSPSRQRLCKCCHGKTSPLWGFLVTKVPLESVLPLMCGVQWVPPELMSSSAAASPTDPLPLPFLRVLGQRLGFKWHQNWENSLKWRTACASLWVMVWNTFQSVTTSDYWRPETKKKQNSVLKNEITKTQFYSQNR